MSKQNKRRLWISAAGALAVFLLAVAPLWFPLGGETPRYIFVDSDDTADSVAAKAGAGALQALGMRTVAALSGGRLHTGRYIIRAIDGPYTLMRHIAHGRQEPVMLTIRSVRTIDDMADDLARHLMLRADDMAALLRDSAACAAWSQDTATAISLFVPNTYSVYWNTTPRDLMARMKKEHDAFWDGARRSKAAALGLTPEQVYTLASIIDEETANNAEKPMIAGMYYNRLMLRNAEYPAGMPLQADPTIKFALKRFDLRRVYRKLLDTDSPYNTYRHIGLPPGPIRVASVAGIDAVLGLRRHDYLYMCANPDFSGTHIFARTYAEHQKNAAAYSRALDERGIE